MHTGVSNLPVHSLLAVSTNPTGRTSNCCWQRIAASHTHSSCHMHLAPWPQIYARKAEAPKERASKVMKPSIRTTWDKKMKDKAVREQFLEVKRAAVTAVKEKRKVRSRSVLSVAPAGGSWSVCGDVPSIMHRIKFLLVRKAGLCTCLLRCV